MIFPTQLGTLEVPPLTFSMALRLTSGGPFDAFFARASTPVTLRSQPVSVQVSPLPAEGRSADFAGAVGQYRLEATLNKPQVNAGDAVTLTLAIAGKGNLRSLEAPKLSELGGFRTFDPKASGAGGPIAWPAAN